MGVYIVILNFLNKRYILQIITKIFSTLKKMKIALGKCAKFADSAVFEWLQIFVAIATKNQHFCKA